MRDITVVIPTYNGAKRLPLVLDRLRSQMGVEEFSWEIIVVDNNSKDETRKVVEAYQKEWLHQYPLKYCLETNQGAAFARKRGIAEARSHLVGFLDDDNVPEKNWVAAAYSFSEKYPKAGAYVSQVSGDFEGNLPPDFERIKPFFGIVERGDKPLLYQPKKRVIPPSAGLIVRREAWVQAVPQNTILTGRVPGSMLAGEDTEAISHIQKSGW